MSETDPNGEDEEKKRRVLPFSRLLDHLAQAPPECERVPSTETQTLVTQRARWMNVSNKGHMLLALPNGLIVQILGALEIKHYYGGLTVHRTHTLCGCGY